MLRPMTPADLRVALDSLGLPNAQVATLMGITEAAIYRYVRPSRISAIPDERAAVVRALISDFDAAADRIAKGTEGPEAEVIRLYSTEADFWRAIPELEGWPLRSQSLVIAEAQRRVDNALPVVFS